MKTPSFYGLHILGVTLLYRLPVFRTGYAIQRLGLILSQVCLKSPLGLPSRKVNARYFKATAAFQMAG